MASPEDSFSQPIETQLCALSTVCAQVLLDIGGPAQRQCSRELPNQPNCDAIAIPAEPAAVKDPDNHPCRMIGSGVIGLERVGGVSLLRFSNE